MRDGEWEGKPGGEELRPEAGHAQTGATHPSGSHAPPAPLARSRCCAALGGARASESSGGSNRDGGWSKRGRGFASSPTSAARLRPSNALLTTRTPFPGSLRVRPHSPGAGKPRGTESGREPPGAAQGAQRGTTPGFAAQLGKPPGPRGRRRRLVFLLLF